MSTGKEKWKFMDIRQNDVGIQFRISKITILSLLIALSLSLLAVCVWFYQGPPTRHSLVYRILPPGIQRRLPVAVDPPAPLSVLNQIPQRMQRLRPGMREERVWKELGMNGYRRDPGPSNGPPNQYGLLYDLGSGYTALFCFDCRRKPKSFNEGYVSNSGGIVAQTPHHDPH
jgi:hypothetical protein